MEYETGTTGDFQRSTRMPLDAVVRLHFEGTVAYQNGFAANVSATGMFVKHPAPPPVGTSLVFEFNLGPQRKPVQGTGEVVWVRDRYLGPGQPAGIGIRFAQVDSQSRDHIAEALFDFLERSLAEDSYMDTARLADEIGAEPEAIATLAPPVAAPPRIDLASVARLPSSNGEATASAPPAAPLFSPTPAAPSAPEGAAPERQPFAVFSSLDSADAKTAAIVREALRDEPPPLFSPAGAGKVKSSGPSPLLWIVPALLVAGVGGWFAWQKWGASAPPAAVAAPAAPPAAPARPLPEPLSAQPSPGTLAEAVGVDPAARSVAANPPISRETAAAEPEPSDVEAAQVEAAQAAPEPTAPAPAAVQPAVAEPLPETPRPAVAEARAARSVQALSLAESAGGATLQIAGDGAFAAGSFSYSEIGGDNPRVLIKLRGMESPYRGPSAGANRLVRGVRTGYHLTSRGNEVHVVVDLVAPGARVEALEPGAAGLLLRLSAR